MDNIANKIDKLYNQSTYTEKYGGSIFMTVIILFVFFIALSYFYVMSKAQPIKDNWVNERCSPAVMPFAGLINKPEDQTAFDFTGDNFAYCTQNILQEITGIFLIPINAAVNIVLSVFAEIAEAIQAIRNIITNIRDAIGSVSEEIMSRILGILIPFQKIIISMRDGFGKIQGVLTASLFTFMGVYDTMMTGINATWELMIAILIVITVAIIILLAIIFTIPAGLIGVALYIPVAIIMITMIVLMSDIMKQSGMSTVPPVPHCFAKGTKLKNKDGKQVDIQDIKLGTELYDGSIVTATMKLSSHDEVMFDLNDVIVSGTHKVVFDGDFILVKDHPESKEITDFYEEYIYCINTNTKIISIDTMIFCDWDELDEMDIIEIKLKCSEIIDDCNIDTFNNESIHKHIDSGLHGDTLIELEDGRSLKIKDIEVNDILKYGERVIGTVKVDGSDIKLFNHSINNNTIIGTANIQIYNSDLGIFNNTLHDSVYNEEIKNNKPNTLYHLLTDTFDFSINDLTIYDYNGAIESFLDEDEYYIISE